MARLLVLLLFFVSSFSQAAGGSSSETHRWRLTGYYGVAAVNPSDVNGSSAFNSVVPKPGSLSTDSFYGAGVGCFLSPKVDVRLLYELQNSKNPTNLTSPTVSNGGIELFQNELWGQINYYLVRDSHFYAYVGGGLGYPLYSHATLTLAATTGYDADKSLSYMGQGGIGVMFGNHLSLFLEGGYQFVSMSNLKSSSGAALTTAGGGNAKMDLSGPRGQVGLAILF